MILEEVLKAKLSNEFYAFFLLYLLSLDFDLIKACVKIDNSL